MTEEEQIAFAMQMSMQDAGMSTFVIYFSGVKIEIKFVRAVMVR